MSQKLPFEQMHQHEYTARVVPATCTERGYTLHVCECGEEYKDSFTPLIPHDFKPDGEIAPTCTQPGKRLFACSVCGAKKEEPIPATGHKLGAAAVSVYPGCVSEGISERKCSLCGETVQTPIPPTGHRFGEWTDRKKAGCKNSGVRARQCEVCGKIESEKTPALGHDFSKWSAAAGDPIKEERYCLRCGMTENRNGDDAQTLYNVGKTHLTNGRYADARENLRLAAEKGLPEAQYEYGLLLRRGDKDHKRDEKAGNEWIKKAAENGDRKAGKWLKRDKGVRIVALSFLGALCVFLILLFTVIIPRYRTFVYDGTNSADGTKNRYTKAIIKDGVTEIKANTFRDCYKLTEIVIPDSVTSIGEYAFRDCSGLTSITIPNGVTSIGWFAFFGCSNLTSVYYTGDVAGWCEIEFGLFDANPLFYARNLYLNDTLLTELVIPDTVTAIKSCAFSGYSSLTSVTIPDSVTSIGYDAFNHCSGLTSVTIPNNVTSIGSYAFCGCSGLTSVTIPDSVMSIGGAAFSGCSGLTSVVIPDSVTCIESSTFYNCSGLTSVTIPDSVTSIGNYAFYNCSGLTSVTIPDSVTSIGNYAFAFCNGLTSITIPDSVTSIGSSAFWNCTGLTSVTFENANGWYRTQTQGASSGESMTVTDPTTNARNLRSSSYYSYYWYRKETHYDI